MINFDEIECVQDSDIKESGDIFKLHPVKKVDKHLHSELHELVDKCRHQFNETAKNGKGSFTFYLGFFKRVGLSSVYRILAEMKETDNEGEVRLFWWKISQELKARK